MMARARETRAQRAERRRRDAIGWEYYQDERDRAAAAGALMVIGIGTLMALTTVAAIALVVIELMHI